MTSELKVNTLKKQSGSSITIGESGDTITITAGATLTGTVAGTYTGTVTGTVNSESITAKGDGSSADGKITLNCSQNSHGVKIQSPAHSAGQSYTLILPTSVGTNGQVLASDGSNTNQLSWVTATETKPTISSINPSVIENTATDIVITGTNFVSVPIVEAINSTGAITAANSVTFTSATSITANFTLGTDGTYFIRIENNDGNAVRSGTALLTVSDAPAWVTAAGSLGSFDGGSSVGTITLTATNSTGMTLQSGSLPGGLSLNTGSGSSTITGTESGATADTTYNFTIRATDAEGQTADRAFSITITLGISNAMRFDP